MPHHLNKIILKSTLQHSQMRVTVPTHLTKSNCANESAMLRTKYRSVKLKQKVFGKGPKAVLRDQFDLVNLFSH